MEPGGQRWTRDLPDAAVHGPVTDTAPVWPPCSTAAVLDARGPAPPRRGAAGARRALAPRRPARTRRPRGRPRARGRVRRPRHRAGRAAGRRRPPPAARPRRPAGGPAPGRGVAALPGGRLRRRHRCRRRPGVVAAALGRVAGGPGRGARRRLPGVGRGRAARSPTAPSPARPRATSSCARAACRWSTRTAPRSWPARGVLLDARAGARYRGRPSRSTRGPGTSPGRATPRPPSTSARTAAGCRRDVLAGRYGALGVDPAAASGVGAYCGSGVNATAVVLALEYAGSARPTDPPRCTRAPGRSGPPTPAAPSRPAPRRERPRGSPARPRDVRRVPDVAGSPRFPTMSPRAAVVWTPEFLSYDLGADHPLNPVRLDLTMRLAARARRAGRASSLLEPEPAADEELHRVHVPSYLAAVRRRPRSGDDVGHGLGTDDNPIFVGMHEASALVCGGSLLAAREIAEGRADRAVNIAGGLHHAMRDHAAGVLRLQRLRRRDLLAARPRLRAHRLRRRRRPPRRRRAGRVLRRPPGADDLPAPAPADAVAGHRLAGRVRRGQGGGLRR